MRVSEVGRDEQYKKRATFDAPKRVTLRPDGAEAAADEGVAAQRARREDDLAERGVRGIGKDSWERRVTAHAPRTAQRDIAKREHVSVHAFADLRLERNFRVVRYRGSEERRALCVARPHVAHCARPLGARRRRAPVQRAREGGGGEGQRDRIREHEV